MEKQINVLQYDARVEKSMARLKAMGVRFYVEPRGADECYIVIDMSSVVQLIDSKLTYPKRRTTMEGKFMLIKFWKGEEVV